MIIVSLFEFRPLKKRFFNIFTSHLNLLHENLKILKENYLGK